MTRSPETAQIIAEVERLSDRKVVVQEDPDLKVMASVKTARGDTPFHVVSYRPGSQATNYLICFQLAFVLRMFTLPEQERWAMSSTPAQRQRAMQDLRLTTFPPQLQEFLLNQLMTQLRTFSIGMRVDQWIIDEFPGLAEEQKAATKLQLWTLNERME